MAADTKRLKGQEMMKDSYLTHQATSFAGRKAEQRLEEAQRVRSSPIVRWLTALFCPKSPYSPPAGAPSTAKTISLCQHLATVCHYTSLEVMVFRDRDCILQVCETLDRRRGMTESLMWLAEPPLQEPDEVAEATEEAEPGPVNPWAELPVAQRLSDVLQRLRTEHFYCIFCGCQVGNEDLDGWPDTLKEGGITAMLTRMSQECQGENCGCCSWLFWAHSWVMHSFYWVL